MSQTRQFLRKPASVLLMLVFVFAFVSLFCNESAFADDVRNVDTSIYITGNKTVTSEDELIETSDELLEQFLITESKPALSSNSTKKRLLKSSSSRGSKLEGANANLYKELKSGIEKIAKGEVDSSVITVKYDKIFDSTQLERGYSASDLKISGDVVQFEGNIVSATEEAKNALSAKYNELIDDNLVINALIADCPYSLYWYDKTLGVESNAQNLVSPIRINNTNTWQVKCC